MKNIMKLLTFCMLIISHLSQGVLWAVQPHQVGISLVERNGYFDLSLTSSFNRGTIRSIRIENNGSPNDGELLRGQTADTVWTVDYHDSSRLVFSLFNGEQFQFFIHYDDNLPYYLGVLGHLQDLNVEIACDLPVALSKQNTALILHGLNVSSKGDIINRGKCLLGAGGFKGVSETGDFVNSGGFLFCDGSHFDLTTLSQEDDKGQFNNTSGFVSAMTISVHSMETRNLGGFIVCQTDRVSPFTYEDGLQFSSAQVHEHVHFVSNGIALLAEIIIDNRGGLISANGYEDLLLENADDKTDDRVYGFDNRSGILAGRNISLRSEAFGLFMRSGLLASKESMVVNASKVDLNEENDTAPKARIISEGDLTVSVAELKGKTDIKANNTLTLKGISTSGPDIEFGIESIIQANQVHFLAETPDNVERILRGVLQTNLLRLQFPLQYYGTLCVGEVDLRYPSASITRKENGTLSVKRALIKVSDLISMRVVQDIENILMHLRSSSDMLIFDKFTVPTPSCKLHIIQEGNDKGYLCTSGEVKADQTYLQTSRHVLGHTNAQKTEVLSLETKEATFFAGGLSLESARITAEKIRTFTTSTPARIGSGVQGQVFEISGMGAIFEQINTFRELIAKAHTLAFAANVSVESAQIDVKQLQLASLKEGERVKLIIKKDSRVEFIDCVIADGELRTTDGKLVVVNKHSLKIIPGQRVSDDQKKMELLPSVIHGEKGLTVHNEENSRLQNIAGQMSSNGTTAFLSAESAVIEHLSAHNVAMRTEEKKVDDLDWWDRYAIGDGGYGFGVQEKTVVRPKVEGKKVLFQGGNHTLEAVSVIADEHEMDVDSLKLALGKNGDERHGIEVKGRVLWSTERKVDTKDQSAVETQFLKRDGTVVDPKTVKIKSKTPIVVQQADDKSGQSASSISAYLIQQGATVETIKMIHERLEKVQNRSLAPVSRAIITIAVTAATQGLGGAAALGLNTTSAFVSGAVNAFMTTGLNQVTTTFISAAIGDKYWYKNIASKEALMSLCLGSLSAGFVTGLGNVIMPGSFDLYRLPNIFEKPLEHLAILGMKEAAHCIVSLPMGEKWTLMGCLGRALQGEISSVMTHAVSGVGKDYNFGQPGGKINYFEHKFAQGMLALGEQAVCMGLDAATNEKGVDPLRFLLAAAAATVGAVSAEMIAENYFNTKRALYSGRLEELGYKAAKIGKLSAAGIGLCFLNPDSMFAAQGAANKVIDNNFLHALPYVIAGLAAGAEIIEGVAAGAVIGGVAGKIYVAKKSTTDKKDAVSKPKHAPAAQSSSNQGRGKDRKTPNAGQNLPMKPNGSGKNQQQREPSSLQDQMTLQAAKDGHGIHEKIMENLGDPKFKGMEKWQLKVKSNNGKDSVVHYVRDPKTGKLMDFKFTKKSTD